MKPPALGAVVLMLISLWCASVSARGDVDAPKVDPAKKARAAAPLPDAEILSLIHRNDREEIAAGELVSDHTGSEDIREFGARLEKDHKNSDLEVRALAGRLGVKLNEDAAPQSTQDRKALARRARRAQKLMTLKDAAFDRAFVDLMVHDQEKIIHLLERQKKLLPKDSPVFDLLGQLLPVLREHYQVAINLSGLPKVD